VAIWRIETCKAEAGYRSNASIYTLIRDGLWTKPVPIGQRSVGWPDDEIRALCAARIAGLTDVELRALVTRLHTKRADRLVLVCAGVDK
jgi:prophage regulatory protein